MLFGVQKYHNNHALKVAVREFLLRVNILPWGASAAKSYASLRSELNLIGKPLGNMDLMIAAHALAVNAISVTHDKAFEIVPKLKQVDWTLSESEK